MRRRLSCQRGQAAFDYLAVLVAAAAAVALLVIAAPSLGEKIVCAVQNQLAKLGIAEPCHSETVAGADQPICVVSDSSGEVKVELTAFSVQGGGQIKLLRQKLAGGEVRITLSGGGKAGLVIGEGGKVKIDTGGGGGGGGDGVQGDVNLNGELGATWVFPSDGAADEFVDILRNKARDTFLDTALPPIGFINHLIGTDEDRDLRGPDIVYGQGGVGGGVEAEGPADLAIDGTTMLGVRRDLRSGETTAYLGLKGSGELSVAGLLNLDPKLALEGQLQVTFDIDGNPIKASIVGSGSADARLGIDGEIRDPSDLISKLKLGANDGAGGRLEIRGDLDLTLPENRQAFDAFRGNPLTGALGLGRAVLRNGRFSARAYTTNSSKVGPDIEGADGLAFGFEASYESIDSDLVGAWQWDGDQGFRPWVTCKR